jgi:hypothetical protein
VRVFCAPQRLFLGAQRPEKVERDTQAERWRNMDFHLESFDNPRDMVGVGDISNAVKLLSGNRAKSTPRGISTGVAQNKGTSMRDPTICQKPIQLKNNELTDQKGREKRGPQK